ncbi:ATP-binding protein [Terasakiella sp. A23]|uniref:ATP-binding protein n=1 Tax=Terasakiella sp. FCG-A23 TaxID=3080561 RepID=UPI0029549D9C|nr:ATP-binding protein [Terasakiella sp. A23]MDV7341223.1 ATP-binding protein [Terasakiella sp. A23]
MSKTRKIVGKFAPYSRLASRYLLFSLVIALLPLFILSLLYDNYVVELIEEVTDQKNTTQVVAYENTVRHFIKERAQELDDLKAQFDRPQFYQSDQTEDLIPELEAIVRVLLDNKSIYGVVFYNAENKIVRTFPSDLNFIKKPGRLPYVNSDQLKVLGPSTPENGLPSWFILKSQVNAGEEGIGLVLRFATLTGFMNDFSVPGIREAYLKTPDGKFYDAAGRAQDLPNRAKLRNVIEILPGWQVYLDHDTSVTIPQSKQVRYFLILTAIITALVILYLNYSVSNRINKQIGHLLRRVEKVAQGDINTPLKVSGNWEIHNLSLSIESMRNQLRKFIRSSLEMERRASLGQMAAGVAHEVRNPLATINTAVQALSKTETDQEKLELMGIMSDEISRTNTVIEDLLDYARPRDPQPELFEVQELIDHTKTLADVVAKKQHITILAEIKSDPSTPLTIYGDPVHMRQVLLNLVLNGLQAMEGMKGGHVLIRARLHKEGCELAIADEGEGIDPEKIARIVEPFFTTKAQGTGLGLSICSSLISRNHGTMTFESEPGKGTTVLLNLPRKAWQEENEKG